MPQRARGASVSGLSGRGLDAAEHGTRSVLGVTLQRGGRRVCCWLAAGIGGAALGLAIPRCLGGRRGAACWRTDYERSQLEARPAKHWEAPQVAGQGVTLPLTGLDGTPEFHQGFPFFPASFRWMIRYSSALRSAGTGGVFAGWLAGTWGGGLMQRCEEGSRLTDGLGRNLLHLEHKICTKFHSSPQRETPPPPPPATKMEGHHRCSPWHPVSSSDWCWAL